MKVTDRYSTAVHSSSLKSRPETTMSDTDVLSAMAIADRALSIGKNSDSTPVRPAPLAVPLERLFAGDNNAAYEIVRMLAQMAYDYSRRIKVKLQRPIAYDMACACLAWHRNGRCRPCGGHGFTLIPGSKTHSGHECQACRGTGRVPFESQFRQEHQAIARWLVTEMEREAGRAGPQAMKLLASSMDL